MFTNQIRIKPKRECKFRLIQVTYQNGLCREYQLSENGKLITKFPRNKPRKLLKSMNEMNTPTSNDDYIDNDINNDVHDEMDNVVFNDFNNDQNYQIDVSPSSEEDIFSFPLDPNVFSINQQFYQLTDDDMFFDEEL